MSNHWDRPLFNEFPKYQAEAIESPPKRDAKSHIKELYAKRENRIREIVLSSEAFSNPKNDADFAKQACIISSKHRERPDCFPSPYDLFCLAILLLCKSENAPADRNLIVKESKRITGKALNLAPVYRSFERLLQAGYIDEIPYAKKRHGGKVRRIYEINNAGYSILRSGWLLLASIEETKIAA